jgi:aspartate racemase
MIEMDTIKRPMADLSAEARELFELLLKKEGLNPSRSHVPREKKADSFRLSFAQERFWFLEQLDPDSSAYNVPVAFRLTGSLNVPELEHSLNEILRRHEALRATFVAVNGQPVQVIVPDQTLKLSLVDLREFPKTEREIEALTLATEEAQRPFDLARGPLLRVTLLRLADEEYVLLLTTHHLVADGWSMIVFMRELSVLYEAFLVGAPSPLPELPVQYADVALRQRELPQEGGLEAQVAYWKRQLAGAPPVLELPTDRPRPSVQSYRGATQSFELPVILSEAIRAFSRREGVTVFMALQAAFQTLLYRYTFQDDIVVGTAVSERNRIETEGLIGPLSNTLLLRTDFRGDPTFRKLLEQSREVTLEAYAHQDLPFEKLIEELQPVRDLSRAPFFQVMFVLHQSALEDNLKLAGLTLSRLSIERGTARFDLCLNMVDGEGELSGSLEYNTDLYDAATVIRLLGHFQTLLEGIVADPDKRLSSLPILTEAERHQLLAQWNKTATDYPQDRCIHELFEAQVEQTPEAIAVVFENQQLIYRELNARANQLAHCLRKRGVGPEVLVGVCLERSLEMVVGLLGILKAGGAYVPLDPTYPQKRLRFILEDAALPVLLTQECLVESLPHRGTEVVCMDVNWEVFARESSENLASGVIANNLAYVIYTSGSTGRPKGVAIEHHSTVALVDWAEGVFTSEQLAGVLASTSICFDLSVFELFVTLSLGGRVILAENPLHLSTLRAKDDVTLINTVPSAMAELLRVQGVPASAHTVNLAGEPLQNSLVQQIYQLGTVKQVFDLYGPSEDTTYSTFALRSAGGSATIGRPIANTQLYILDPHLQPVPVGMPGEIHIGGAGLARGYLGRPELTAERFIPNPFSQQLGSRLYKTGDLARYQPNGNIEFLGRLDHQVKVRGFRIELGEIEAVLGEHAAVQKAVVLAREEGFGGKHLVAYLVIHQQPGPSISELRSFLKERLPGYMIPSDFVILETLPLTPNGKVDRRALPAPDQFRPKQEKGFVHPRDEFESQLSQIWEQVLSMPLSVTENFFEVGGHSLLAIRLLAQIEKVFDKKLPLATLFQAPTVEQLAQVLRQQGWSPSWSSLVPIQPGGSKRPFFCVPGDLGNVFTDLGHLGRNLGPDQPFYGLQDGIDNPTQIEALAAHYLAEVRTVQTKGPYFLGGVCQGGVVAFEMAQQLRAQGEQVGLLALIEPSNPPTPGLRAYYSVGASIFRRVMRRFAHHLGVFWLLGSAEQQSYLRLKWKVFANLWALVRYAPQTYPDRIILFLASESLARSPQDPRLGWRNFAGGGLELQVIPGHHDTITGNNDVQIKEAHMQVLAEKLRACIEAVQMTLIWALTSMLLHLSSMGSIDSLSII